MWNIAINDWIDESILSGYRITQLLNTQTEYQYSGLNTEGSKQEITRCVKMLMSLSHMILNNDSKESSIQVDESVTVISFPKGSTGWFRTLIQNFDWNTACYFNLIYSQIITII